jgi:hypothetical protein
MKAERLLSASLVEYLAKSQSVPHDLGFLLVSPLSIT